MSKRKLAEAARANRAEIAVSGLSRRDLVKMGLLSAGGYLIAKRGLSSRIALADELVPSPPTTPFVEPLPISPIKQAVATLSPTPTVAPLPGEGRTRDHQAFTRFPAQKFYEVHQREALHSFHPDLPLNVVWGYDGIVPGPTFHARYGEPILIRNFNDLPQNHTGFGSPQVSPHLHNGHTPSESDGFPCDFFPLVRGGAERFYDQHYPNALAGFSSGFAPAGDPREAMSTLWYHDHRVGFTAPNVYKGLAAFYLLFNDHDTGDETTGFRLPSGAFDVPMSFADKIFDGNGQLFFDLFNLDGIIGDKFTVNGKIQPFFQVHPRRYRFRWLNVGPSRFYQLFLTDPNQPGRLIPFTQISTDGNLLPHSLNVGSAELSVAERVDVIVDFSQFAPGTSIILENRLQQKNGRGPTDKLLPAGRGDALLRFDVVLPAVPDESLPGPFTFYDLPAPTQAEISRAVERVWRFERKNGQWAINGEFFDCDDVRAKPLLESGEVWVLQNHSGGWEHPIHVHQEECVILSRNGKPPPPTEAGRKDVVRLGHNEEVRIFRRFRDFSGRYPLHCHNVVHEDHEMMVRFDIVPR